MTMLTHNETINLKKLLRNQIMMEQELLGFIEDCLKEIFGDKANHALSMFEDAYSIYEFEGFLPRLRVFKEKVNLLTLTRAIEP